MSNLNEARLISGSAIGAGIGVLCSAVILLIMATALVIGNIPPELILPMATAALAIGAFAAGVTAAKLGKSKGIVCGALSGVTFFIIAWLSGAIIGEAAFSTEFAIKAAIIILSAALGGIVGINR